MNRATAGLLGALLLPVVVTAADADRVALLADSEPAYDPVARADIPRSYPRAGLHLVVFLAGVPVADHGLRDESRIVPATAGAPPREELRSDSATVATDARSALLVRTEASRAVADPSRGEPVEVTGRTELTWIDPEHPEGRWSMRVVDGRWIREIVILPNGFGAAISTVRDLDEPADLTILSPDGETLLHMDDLEASSGTMTATANGAFLAVDLAYPSRPGLPDRGVLVFDVLTGGSWTYTWSYGSEQEPSGWEIEESGVLVVEIAGAKRRFDRFGRPI